MLLRGKQNGTGTLQNSLAGFVKLNIKLPYDPPTSLLGMNPREMKVDVHTKICTQILIGALKLETTQVSFNM